MGEDYDVIVIGSGMGGLTCAVLLAKHGRRVLLLEKHYQLGGLTQSFARAPGFSWDVGLHYIGGMGAEGPTRLFDYVTDGGLEWSALPDPYDVFVYPEFRFEVPVGEARLRDALVERFGAERHGIDLYLRDVHRAAQWLGIRMMQKAMPRAVDLLASALIPSQEKLALATTRSYLDAHLSDPALRAVLASQWGDYGLPPGESAFGIHALVTSSYYEGASYPVGGARRIAQTALRALEAHGGSARASREVTRVIVEHGRAVGVEVAHHHGDGHVEREDYRAKEIVSDVGAVPTLLSLVPEDVPLIHRASIRRFPRGRSIVILFLGLSSSPAALGVKGENLWVFDSLDHDDMARRGDAVLEGRPPTAFVSFASLRDPEAKLHTAEVMSFVDYEPFERWEGTAHGDRPEAYEALKARIGDGLLALAERVVPGLSALVVERAVSTPLTLEHFTSHPFGAVYGVPAVPDKWRAPWLEIATELPGLYLTGTDVACLGVPGAAMGGAMTAAKLVGLRGLPGIVEEITRHRP